jgi:hypothetical protein
MKTVLIVGAGSTLSDAVSKPLKRRPPLDRGFFTACGKLDLSERIAIVRYLRQNYDIDPASEEHDSLERIMAIIYADISNPLLEKTAVSAFRMLIRLFNRRIAETTNPLSSTNRTNLYRILAKKLKDNVAPSDLSIVTFNQDIQIEKTLARLELTKVYQRLGAIFRFPACYRITNAAGRLSKPPRTISKFAEENDGASGIPLFKLHGSLNWFSSHTSRQVPKGAILNPQKKFSITPRAEIPVGMTYSQGNRTTHTFPLIIPPVNHKAAIIHRDLYPIWELAEKALSKAGEIIVFGYSCPAADFESANLIRRAVRTGANPSSFVVIDPNPEVFRRYVDVTNLDHLSYFRSADSYIEKG